MGTNTLTHRPAGTGGPPASRRGYLDVLRCLAIFLVIALHCTAGQIVRPELFGTRTWLACDIVNGFARMGVPLFFMISGFLLLSSGKTDDIRGFYIHRFSKLLPPFLFWDVLYYFETCAAGGQAPGLLPFLQELTGQGSKYHLWFIYQIAGLYLLMPFLKKILDHSTRREQLAFLAVVLLQPTIFRFLNIIQRTVTFSPFRALVEGGMRSILYSRPWWRATRASSCWAICWAPARSRSGAAWPYTRWGSWGWGAASWGTS